MDIQAVSTAIATSMAGLKIRTYDYGPDAPASPCAYIYPDAIAYHEDYTGDTTATFIVRFLISSVVTRSGQAQLNLLISPTGPGSAKLAIESDPTLGGLVTSSTVRFREHSYGVVQLPDQATRFYSAELLVEVFA